MRWNGVCNFAAFSNPAIIGALRLMAPRTYAQAVEPFSIADADTDERLILELPDEIRRGQQGLGNSVPHVLLREQGRVFTPGFLFFRRLG